MCQFAKSVGAAALAGMVFVSSAVMAQWQSSPPRSPSVINPIVVMSALYF